MTVQWAAELGIPEDVARKLADWDVAVIARAEERFVGELRDAGMRKADATKAWDKLQERLNGTCAALCFAWRARFWQSHSPDPSCSPLAVSSLFSCVSFVSLFSVTGVPLFPDWTRGGRSHGGHALSRTQSPRSRRDRPLGRPAAARGARRRYAVLLPLLFFGSSFGALRGCHSTRTPGFALRSHSAPYFAGRSAAFGASCSLSFCTRTPSSI